MMTMASTARWIAAVRERESARQDCLFHDPYATLFAGDIGRQMMRRSEETAGGDNRQIPVRVRYFDDLVLNINVEQLVLLGAGFDTRATRLNLPPNLSVFELDVGEILEEKQRTLRQANADSRCRVIQVPTQFSPKWANDLLRAGFQPTGSTLWLAEGLLFYLSCAEVESLLRDALHLSGAGSRFAADLSACGILGLREMQPYLSWLKVNGRPAPFCCDDPASMFLRFGWHLSTCVQYGQSTANYGRLPVIPDTFAIKSTSGFLVVAERLEDAGPSAPAVA